MLFSCSFFLTACQSKDPLTSLSGSRMTIAWEVKIAEKLNHQQKQEVGQAVEAVFAQIDAIYNNWNPHSEISQFNRLKAYQRVELSVELSDFLYRVGELVAFTEGRFDPTIEPLQKLYKNSLILSLLPKEEELKELRECIGWDNVQMQGRTFWKKHSKTALDLSGIAKGHAVDLILEKLLSLGYLGIYVEWGGEIKTKGSHKNGSPWRIAIMGGEQMELRDEAIATSGNFYQRFTIEGLTYTHIMDPQSQKPLLVNETTFSSAAVKSVSCATSDALATALMLFPSKEEARNWIAKKGFSAWVID